MSHLNSKVMLCPVRCKVCKYICWYLDTTENKVSWNGKKSLHLDLNLAASHAAFLFHHIVHPCLNCNSLSMVSGVCVNQAKHGCKAPEFSIRHTFVHVCTHSHSHTQHTSLGSVCFAASHKKHTHVSSSSTTRIKRCIVVLQHYIQILLLSVWKTHTHMHMPLPVALHVQLPRHGSLEQTISLHLREMEHHEEGEQGAKLVSEIISSSLQMCLFASCFLLLLPSRFFNRKNMT